jgi:hypothetical protein
MYRSQSAPGLGKGGNALHAYAGDSRSLPLSPEEVEAEGIYYAAASASLTKAAFAILAKDLARRSPDAGAYLTWLIRRGWEWPAVAA